ncbi:hypothetical protein, partial [Escherichia coli]|uniref:hypothetical protein n=1 Tax=Escherichia coli TaxID=562 RepID=UPI0024AD6707
KGVDVHAGSQPIRIAVTEVYVARAVHPCARFLCWQLPAVQTRKRRYITLISFVFLLPVLRTYKSISHE